MTMVLLSVLGMVIASVFVENMTRSRALWRRQETMAAFSCAESGAQRALRALAAGRMPASVDGALGEGSFHATCTAQADGGILIESTGVGRADDPGAPKKTVIIAVRRAEAGTIRVISWRAE